MKLFVDASALVAVLAREDDRMHIIESIDGAQALLSPVTAWEATIALARKHGVDTVIASAMVADLATEYGIDMVPIGREEARLAIEAFARYGKGRHPARLNMADCFAYACARTNQARLLYKGDDFRKTDLA